MKNKAERVYELVELYTIESYNEGIDVGTDTERKRVLQILSNTQNLIKKDRDAVEAIQIAKEAVKKSTKGIAVEKAKRKDSK